MGVFGITDIMTYALGTAIIIVTPGPNSLFVLATATRHGVKTGYGAAAGVFLGDLVLMLSAAFGVASLMKLYPWAFDIVRYAGAAYLGYLGLRILLAPAQKTADSQGGAPTVSEATAGMTPLDACKRAFGISLINVKAVLFFMAFFPQFVDPAYAYTPLTFAALGFIVQLFSMTYLSVLILAGAKVVQRVGQTRWLASLAGKLTGMLFISFGLRLALDRN
ncbi:leucine efflux protein LeuE [Chitinibacteraceae bacterium HSL-7]